MNPQRSSAYQLQLPATSEFPEKLLATLEQTIVEEIVTLARAALEASLFFNALDDRRPSRPDLQYVFKQHGLWRDQFHTWFGLCIAKSGSCAEPRMRTALYELANHICVEMEPEHAGLYREFLRGLGLTDAEIDIARPGLAVTSYLRSFFVRFADPSRSFDDAVLALSARELFVALRNTQLRRSLEGGYGIPASRWLSLHEELEVDHFRATLRPLLPELADPPRRTRLLDIMNTQIRRHVEYWDELYFEAHER